MLEVRSVSVWHGRVQAVRRVSLSVGDGEIVTVLGANGAGKTTLLSAIAGLQPPSEGQILLDGRDIVGLPADTIARLGVRLVPEGRQLIGSMTVRDNLLLGGYQQFGSTLGNLLRPLPWVRQSTAVQDKLAEVFELFPRLRERQGQVAHSLSGGEQQMLAIGRALMASPKVMLLDEPSVGLAPELVRAILGLIEQLRERGLAILLVEQEVYGALRIAQRGYVMETGRMAAEGPTRELLDSEALRRAYLGVA
mgnify:CR=1 FL=1